MFQLNFKFRYMKGTVVLLFAFLVLQALGSSIHELQPTLAHDQTIASTSGRSASAGSIFVGFVLGPFLFFCALVCTWFNEKRAAIDSRRLQLASQICEDVDVTSQASAMQHNGKLVYANGQTKTSNIISDPISGVSSANLIKIIRWVQVLQWRRHTRRENNHDYTYYQLQWCSSNSENEGQRYNSPSNWFINNETTYNPQVYLGGYNIDKATAEKCQKSLPFTPQVQHGQNILAKCGRGDRIPSINGEYIYFSVGGGNSGGYSTMNQGNGGYGMVNQGNGEGSGNLRVKFSLCPTGQLSMCAQSAGATFTPFPIAQYEGTKEQTNGIPDCCCCIVSSCYAELLKPIEEIHLVEESSLSKGEMFDLAIKKSECFTRGVRIGCYLLMVASVCMFFSPITILIGYIPLVGGFISTVLSWAIFIAALIVCLPIFIIVLSAAWLRYHPKVGLVILGVGLAVLAAILIINHSKGGGGSTDTNTTQAQHFLGLTRAIHF